MPIDKFGRPRKRSFPPTPIKGPPGQGFKLTPDGKYDMDNKRLTNLNEPRQKNDAATKTFCDGEIKVLTKGVKEDFDRNTPSIDTIKG